MAIAAAVTGQFGSEWGPGQVMAVALFAGCTAGGYTGVAYAEYANLGGGRRTEATGLGTALMFAGGLLIPPLFGGAVLVLGDYAHPYEAMAILALASAVLLGWPRAAG
jgi:hypothetical protein